jgi:hypothetical protein
MMKLFLIVALNILWFSSGFTQSIKESTFEYTNIKQPLTPLPSSIKNYHVTLVSGYDEKNKKLVAEYNAEQKKAQQEYDIAMKQYPIDVKDAEERFDAEMELYRKKSLGQKVIEKTVLKENTKPIKNLPYKPTLRYVPKPILQTVYDLPTLASTYIKLENYENNTDNALKIIVTLYGYDCTQPRVLNNPKDMISIGSGATSTYKQTYYYAEYSYRHPMSIKAFLPDGKEVMNITPQPLNAYKIYRSGESDKMLSVNNELLVRTTEEKTLQENLAYINKLLNEKFGFYKEKRKTTLYFVKDKKGEYTDLTTAFNEATSALTLLAEDAVNAKTTLMHATDLWEKALASADVNDKKARIDKDVAIAICINLLEVYYALKNYDAGQMVMQKFNTINLSYSDRIRKNDYDNLYNDLKKRTNTK